MSQPASSADRLVADLAARLRGLRVRAGKPSVSRLAALTKLQGSARAMPRATIQDKLSGATSLRLEQLLALVTACAEHAVSIGAPLPADEVDEERWREAWTVMHQASPAPLLVTNDAGPPVQATARFADPEARRSGG